MAEQEQGGNLSLQDIELAVRVIDLVSQRGAIRGDELATVGTLRERFAAFLRAAGVGTKPEEATAEEAETPASE